jgi:hypothetical protein
MTSTLWDVTGAAETGCLRDPDLREKAGATIVLDERPGPVQA